MATNTSDEDQTPVRPKLQGSSGVEGSGAKGDPSFRLRQPDELPTANDVVNINPDTTPLTGHVGQRIFTGGNPAASHRYVSVSYPDSSSSGIGGAGEEVTIPEPEPPAHPWAMTFTVEGDEAILDILDGLIFDEKLSVVSLLDKDNKLDRTQLNDYEPVEGHVWVLTYDYSEIVGVTQIDDGVAKFKYEYFNTTDEYVPTNTDLEQTPPTYPTKTHYPLGIIKYNIEEEFYFVQQIATTNLCATTICYSGSTSQSLTPV